MKTCIFNSTKTCDNCGECDRCDLDRNKICDNCGKCLEMEGYDVKAIKIDEVFDNGEETSNIEKDYDQRKEDLLDSFGDFEFEEDEESEEEHECHCGHHDNHDHDHCDDECDDDLCGEEEDCECCHHCDDECDHDDYYDEELTVEDMDYIDALDDENNWEYIDDLDEIKELGLEEDEKINIADLGTEMYPGLISFKHSHKRHK